MSELQYYQHTAPFSLEGGETLKQLQIAYMTWGNLNKRADNVIWVCHAYTANADVASWWPGMVGPGLLMDPEKYFIVCANVIGSCYGTTGPLDIDPNSGKTWLHRFPMITVRDLVEAHELLRQQLNIKSIHMIIGGSIGAFQAIEWSIMYPDIIKNLVFIASSAFASPWNIAFNEAQRMAIFADPSYFSDHADGGKTGLKAARAMALISYRHAKIYNHTQAEDTTEKLRDFKAVSYQQYQGEKLIQRYNAFSYVLMSRLFDSHNVGRGRTSVLDALNQIKARATVIALNTDILFPPDEQAFVASHIPNATFHTVKTLYGHDGFLLEAAQISEICRQTVFTP